MELSLENRGAEWLGEIIGYILIAYCIYWVLKRGVSSWCKREVTKAEKNVLAVLAVGLLVLLFVIRAIA